MLRARQPLVLLVLAAVLALLAFAAGLWWFGRWHDEWSGHNARGRIGDGRCNVAVVPVAGEIGFFGHQSDGESPVADADRIVATIRQAEAQSEIRGILVRVDSPGGGPVASRVIADALERSKLPKAAVIRESGTSGGYVVATGADTIFADPMSDVGSIGVTESYVENVEKNRREGLSYVPLTSAKYKDYRDPNRPLTREERALIERDLRIVHDELVRLVARNRKLPVEHVAKLADGSSMPGALALESKLVDALGGEEAARGWFAERLRIPATEIRYCDAVIIDPDAKRERPGREGG
jgi:signal peptide peptidase SppA